MIYAMGFVVHFLVMFSIKDGISEHILRRINSEATDKDRRVKEYFSNLAETEGDEFATKKFNMSILMLFIFASTMWPIVLFTFLTKGED
jgi:hypothetical protein